jgi:hypothetical protein
MYLFIVGKASPEGQFRAQWFCPRRWNRSKSEARNPKSETISNDQNSNDINNSYS